MCTTMYITAYASTKNMHGQISGDNTNNDPRGYSTDITNIYGLFNKRTNCIPIPDFIVYGRAILTLWS